MARSRTDRGHAVVLAVVETALAVVAWWAVVGGQLRLGGAAVAAAGLAGLWATREADASGSGRGGFASEAAERVLDAGSLVPLAWVTFGAEARVAIASLAALGMGAVASYARARARGLDIDVPRWPAYRAARTAALAAGLALERPEPFLWAMVAADAGVLAARWRLVARRA